MKTSFLSVLLIALPSYVYSEINLPDIVISATRNVQSSVTTPTSISIITEKEISASGATDISGLLRSRGGMVVSDLFGDGSRPTIGLRGFSESANANTLIMVDGRRLNNADIGNPQITGISLKDIRQIEIIKGSAGVLFGDQAVGGVINIITKRPDAYRAKVGLSVGSYSSRKAFFSIEDYLKNGFGYRFSAETKGTSNYRDRNNLEYNNLFGRVDYHFNDGVIFAELSHVNERIQTPGAITLLQLNSNNRRQEGAFNPGDYSNTKTDFQRLGVQYDVNDTWSFEAEYTNSRSKNPFVNFSTFNEQERKLSSFNPRVINVFNINGSEAILTAGIDYEQAEFNIASAGFFAVNRNNELENISYYAQQVFPLSERFTITAGARHAEQKNKIIDAVTYVGGKNFNTDETVGELGLSFNPSSELRLFARIDQNFRFPKIDEQSYTTDGVTLKNQTGNSWEFGAEFQNNNTRFSANLYRLNLKNEIAFDATATRPTGGAFAGANVNFDPTRHEGFIVEGINNFSNDLVLSGSYTYTNAYFLSGINKDKKISAVPAHTARVGLDYRLTNRFDVFAESIFTGKRFESGDNANVNQEVDANMIANLNLSYKDKRQKISLGINNVFDQKYVDSVIFSAFGSSYYPAPGRSFLLQWEMTFNE